MIGVGVWCRLSVVLFVLNSVDLMLVLFMLKVSMGVLGLRVCIVVSCFFVVLCLMLGMLFVLLVLVMIGFGGGLCYVFRMMDCVRLCGWLGLRFWVMVWLRVVWCRCMRLVSGLMVCCLNWVLVVLICVESFFGVLLNC